MRPKRIAVLLAAGALLVAGCGGSDNTSGTASAQNRPPAGANGGFLSGTNLTKLADAMGVSKTKLQDALKDVMPQRPENGSGQPPQGTPDANAAPPAGGPGNNGRLATQLAKKLGISEAKVRDALAKVMPDRPTGAQPPGGQTS